MGVPNVGATAEAWGSHSPAESGAPSATPGLSRVTLERSLCLGLLICKMGALAAPCKGLM